MNKIENIREKMAIMKLKQESKSIPRKDLEELWVEESYKEESNEFVNSGWRTFSLICLFVIIILTTVTIIQNTDYPNSEYSNYRSIGKVFCEEQKLGNIRYVQLTENSFKTVCYNGIYEVDLR